VRALQEQYRGLELILKKCLGLLKALARGNDFVQLRMFERLDILLKIKVVESDVAVALKEVSLLRDAVKPLHTCGTVLRWCPSVCLLDHHSGY